MKVVFTGDRNERPEYRAIVKRELDKLNKWDIVIVGDCPTGVDALVRELAPDAEIHKANWERFGRAAGPKRNRAMLARAPDYVVAVHQDLEKSKGTKNCVNTALGLGIEVKVRTK